MTFLLAHLSDPHVPPLPVARVRELAGKRMLGYLNWTRNRHARHSRAMLDALVADMQAQQPDHIAVTGDLVNLSLESEYAPARRWIESVGTPDRVTVIPGNHDAYVKGAAERFDRTFADYIAGDAREANPSSSNRSLNVLRTSPSGERERVSDAVGLQTASTMVGQTLSATPYPFVRRRGDVVFIATSSAVATAPLMATGWLGDPQRDALDAALADLATQNLFRVVLIHHPLRSHARHKRLTDSEQVRAILQRRGADLVLHGHDHVHATIHVEGARGPIPVIGVPSASATTGGKRPAAAYNLFAIDRAGEGWRVTQTVRGFDESGVLRELAKVDVM